MLGPGRALDLGVAPRRYFEWLSTVADRRPRSDESIYTGEVGSRTAQGALVFVVCSRLRSGD